MLSEKRAKNRVAGEQQLLRNYSILKMIEIKPKDHYFYSIGGFMPYYAYNKKFIEKYKNLIKDGCPKTISINYHQTEYESENEFFYLVESNHLTIDLWHPNYDEGLKMVSRYWAVRSAAKTNDDKFKKYNLLINTFTYAILITMVIFYWNFVYSGYFEWLYFNSFNSFNSFNFINFPLISCLIIYVLYWFLYIRWRKRIKVRSIENLKEIGLILSKSERKFLTRYESPLAKVVMHLYCTSFPIFMIVVIYYS